MFTLAADRLNGLRSSEAKLSGRGRGFTIESDSNDNTKMENDKKEPTLSAQLAKISEIEPQNDAGNAEEVKNVESDFDISYLPLKNCTSLKENLEKLCKSWQPSESDDISKDDKALFIDYEPLLTCNARSHSLSFSTLNSLPELYESDLSYDPYCSDSSDLLYVPILNEDTLEYEYVPVIENRALQDKKSNYDLTTYHERPSKYYPSDFNARAVQKPRRKSDYFSIDEEKDPVSALYIWCSRNKAIPIFTFTSEMEARGKSVIGITFICKITLFSSSSIGQGTNKKEAKKVASEKMLSIINSGFKDDFMDRINRNLNYLEITDRQSLPDTVIIKAQENDVKLVNNPISYLQEICLKQKWTVPDYRIETFGSLFKCSARIFIKTDPITDTGFGHTKKEAKINAARNLIALCQNRGFISKFH